METTMEIGIILMTIETGIILMMIETNTIQEIRMKIGIRTTIEMHTTMIALTIEIVTMTIATTTIVLATLTNHPDLTTIMMIEIAIRTVIMSSVAWNWSERIASKMQIYVAFWVMLINWHPQSVRSMLVHNGILKRTSTKQHNKNRFVLNSIYEVIFDLQ